MICASALPLYRFGHFETTARSPIWFKLGDSLERRGHCLRDERTVLFNSRGSRIIKGRKIGFLTSFLIKSQYETISIRCNAIRDNYIASIFPNNVGERNWREEGRSTSFENNRSERISLLTRIIVDARDVDPNPSRSWPPVSRQCVKVSREGCTSGDRVGIHARSPVLCAPVKVTVVDVSLPLNGNPCSFIAVSSHRTFPSNENTFDLLLSSPAIEQETV